MTNDQVIVSNPEEISYSQYINRLLEIVRDCNREEYLSEVFMPFLRMCCPEKTKVIPVFDDRRPGSQNNIETEFKKRMNLICAQNEDESYTVPDYIFVPHDYTFYNPKRPFFMVETKLPKMLKEGKCYLPLEKTLNLNKTQLRAEIKSCGKVIYTDGFTWMFLALDDNNQIIHLKGYKTICLKLLKNKYYSTFEAENKIDIKRVDLTELGLEEFEISTEPTEWLDLKKSIYNLIDETRR